MSIATIRGSRRRSAAKRSATTIAALAVTAVAAGAGLTATSTALPYTENATFAEGLPFVVTTAEAARQYVSLVKPYNDAADRVFDAIEAEDLERLQRAAERVADENRRFNLGLQDSLWPRSLQTTMDAFIAAVAGEQTHWRALARADSPGRVIAVMVTWRDEPPEAQGLAELIRQRLALPERGLDFDRKKRTSAVIKATPASTNADEGEPPVPDPPAPAVPALPALPALPAVEGTVRFELLDDKGCAEAPANVLRAVNRWLPVGYRAHTGVALASDDGSAFMTMYINDNTLSADYWLDARGRLYELWSSQDVDTNVPPYPGDVGELGNSVTMGLGYCYSTHWD